MTYFIIGFIVGATVGSILTIAILLLSMPLVNGNGKR